MGWAGLGSSLVTLPQKESMNLRVKRDSFLFHSYDIGPSSRDLICLRDKSRQELVRSSGLGVEVTVEIYFNSHQKSPYIFEVFIRIKFIHYTRLSPGGRVPAGKD